ncbi:PREDICTED: uncharacterized protein LOC107186431 [Dufourea novaeangliae]|uniref:Brinker DNA-binding domain-containing protein n=1 Tax=Dufourea novaeangliae TaxID=178035 RepID=A0A154P8I1_DUFNO|nr:PREDICTED: uncharacterized protein LOC107186431 [Dufourea novaeangliae]KZC08229.1 hypothetical protein WN55_10962 [Dufourea novaeangliae]
MAHGVSEVLGEGNSVKMVHQKQQQQQQSVVHQQQQTNARKSVGVMGSRRIFAPAFKLKVLDSYRNDIDCRGNQRATARKYGIHRRQIQKWLQCEDNLRNSCAESGNTGVVSTTVISSAGVSKPDGTVTEATGPAVTPAAPALNLSLARLHGDELATQQGPPPLLPRPPHGGSPSSPQYVTQSTTVPMMPVRVGYQEYNANQEQHHLRRETGDNRVQVADSVHGYSETHVEQDQQSNRYYVLNTDVQREIESSVPYDGRNEVKVYQNLTNYRVPPRREHRYNGNEVIGATVHQHRSPSRNRSQQNYGDVDSSMDGKSSYGLLLAPSMIKTERASPDSAATPGPCESTSSPGVSRIPLSPVSHHASSSSSSSSSSTTSIHFDSPRTSASPCLHVHEHEHAHASPFPDSEKPIQESKETTVHIGENVTEETTEEIEIGRAVVKEELHTEEEQETNNEGIDYQRPSADSRPVSPVHDREGYSLPSSPRGPTSSGRSSSSCSDSEMDPLDCSSGSHNSSNDLARRRSFSLRFKLDVLDAFHRDIGVAGNQRATARKFGINRRQVQKWLGQETELRGEIAVRGNSRQRLGPIQDVASGESPMDLRTSNYVSSLSHDRIETEYERSPPPPYCCDVGSSSSYLPYYHHPIVVDPSSESELASSCNLSCCMDSHAATPVTSCYQEVSLRGSCYTEPRNRVYCYSPREYSSEIASTVAESAEEFSSPLKRQHCTLSCCYEALQSPKRLCLESEEPVRASSACQETPPQETPLCLVKPKRLVDVSPLRTEPVTSTVPTPPASAVPPPAGPTSKKDAILFKPYLDNPVSKPAKEPTVQRELSPVSSQNIVNNNNNCQSICNFNEGRGHDYALELSLKLPVSWGTHPSPYTEFPQVRSAFIRYPASPHYS